MILLGRSATFVISIAMMLPISAGAQQTLIRPNWGLPSAQAYLAERAKPGFEADFPQAQAPGEEEFTLPVLGLLASFEAAEPPRSLAERFISADPERFDWPTCASPTPEVSTARDGSGTWYTLNYDFGCLHVSINGDRNTEAASPDASQVPDGDVVLSVGDEDDDPDKVSELSIAANRFGLPYLVTIECLGEDKNLCRPAGPWAALLKRLSILDGQP